MKEHILLEKAYRYPEPTNPLAPEGCTFSEQKGYWVNSSTDEVMMLSKNSRRLQTKKADI